MSTYDPNSFQYHTNQAKQLAFSNSPQYYEQQAQSLATPDSDTGTPSLESLREKLRGIMEGNRFRGLPTLGDWERMKEYEKQGKIIMSPRFGIYQNPYYGHVNNPYEAAQNPQQNLGGLLTEYLSPAGQGRRVTPDVLSRLLPLLLNFFGGGK